MLRVKQVIGGRRNVTLHITGMLQEGNLQLTPIDLDPDNRLEPGVLPRAKLANLLWIVQEKLIVGLYWGADSDESIIMPLESRNSVRLDPSMPAPDRWGGQLWIDTQNWAAPGKSFFIAVDFDL